MKKLIPTALFLALSCAAWAQADRRPGTLGAGLEVTVPLGEFQESWGRSMVGLSGNLAVPMRTLPFDWGADFSWARMGGDSRTVPVQVDNLTTSTGDLRVNSNIFGYHGILRLKPFNGKVSPYVEGLLGTRQFTTRTKIKVDGMDAPYFEERNANEFVFSHGWAAGIQYSPAKGVYLEIRAERLNGGQVDHVDPRSIQISDTGTLNYNTLRSGTRTLGIHVGAGFRF